MLPQAIARILNRRQAYRRTFAADSRDARMVLSDLRRFCGADRAVYRVSPVAGTVDANATLVAAGRLEVWQRIQAFLNMNDADLARLQDRSEGENHE